MLLTTILIFFITIIIAFGMLAFRAWEIRTARVSISESTDKIEPDLSFRHVEKSMLYLTKHIVQSIVLALAKCWFIITTKIKKCVTDKWPYYFQKKPEVSAEHAKPSFFKKAILESKTKIRRIKEKVRREHE